jgi:hypothetical protein
MASLTLLIVLSLFVFIITIINPFYIIPLFIVGSLVEPVQYFPGLKEYNPTTLIGICVVIGWLLHMSFKGGFESAQSKQVVMFWFFLLWAGLSSYHHMESSWGIFLMYLRAFIPYLLFLYIIKTRQQLSIVIWLLVIVSSIAAIYGIYCLKANIGLSDRGVKRIVSFFSNPNSFGNTMTLMVPITLGLLFYDKYTKLLKAFILWALALIVTGVIISYSRKCFFALSAAILLTPYKLSKKGKKISALILTIILTLSVAYIYPDRVKWRLWSRVTTVFEAESMEELDLGRTETTKAGYIMMLENPIIGVGFGGFKTGYVNIANEATSNIQLVGEEGLGAHNLYVQVGASIGHCCPK